MAESEKTKLTLSVDAKIVKKAKDDPNINISEITEKVLRAFTASSEIKDKEKIYENYNELFKLMLPLLRKFKVRTEIAQQIIFESPSDYPDWEPDLDPDGVPMNDEPIPSHWYSYFLKPDGKLEHEEAGEIKIKDIPIDDFHRPQHIIDELLNSIQEGVNYRKEQFKEIEMAKTIIDAITKGVIRKPKGKGKK